METVPLIPFDLITTKQSEIELTDGRLCISATLSEIRGLPILYFWITFRQTEIRSLVILYIS